MKETKTVLVTGASSGIGRETARRLAERGYAVFGTSRRAPGAASAEGVEMLALDVDDDASARQCVAEVLERAGRIDVLVNNAGYALAGSLEETSLDEAKAQFETNFFGVVRMVNAVLPHMRERRQGAIVTIGSLAGFLSIPFMGFYSATKFALEGYCEELRQELAPFGIRVTLVEPGWVKTAIGEHVAMTAEQIPDYASSRKGALAAIEDMIAEAMPPEAVAARVLKIIESPNPRLRNLVGKEAKILLGLRRLTPASVFDKVGRNMFRLEPAA